MQKIIEIKLSILETYPYMLDFGKTMYEYQSVEQIRKIVDEYLPDLYLKVYSHYIDYSLFKHHIDIGRTVKMIELFLDGYSEQLLQKYKISIASTKELIETIQQMKFAMMLNL